MTLDLNALARQNRERWNQLEEATPTDEMIYVEGDWYQDWNTFLEYCLDNEYEPSAHLPIIGEPYRLVAPRLADCHDDDATEDGELPDFIAEAQALLDDFYAKAEYHWYMPGNKRPANIPTLAQLRAEESENSGETAS